MEATRKRAYRLREQVARQAFLKQFGSYGSDNTTANDADLQQHHKLVQLYISTRAAKHFQRDIARGVEGYIITWSKQVEIGTKLSEDGRKYSVENTCTTGKTLSKAASSFSRALAQMEKERGNLLKDLGTQVAEPLRAMMMGAPLEEARHLAQRYGWMRREAEAQAVEVARRQAQVREGTAHPDMALKLIAAKVKLQDVKSNVATLRKEAAAAMAAVEAQQQTMTLERLIAMVEAERAYHRRALQIVDLLESEMMSERQRIEADPIPSMDSVSAPPPTYEDVNGVSTSPMQNGATDTMGYFLGEVVYSYQAESDV